MLEPSISVKLPSKKTYNYPIYINCELLNNYQFWLQPIVKSKKIIIITDKTVEKLYGRSFANKLEYDGYEVLLLSINPGEESKSFLNFEYLLNEMIKHKCDRHSLCIALGGGVVGDITGFVASVFMRGIRFIQIPTTLLSMIDSSVGGKTAINSMHGKNLIGAFYQPQAVIMDINLVQSLAKKELINGLIEAIKIFLTCDAKYFNYTVNNLDDILLLEYPKLVKVISRAVELKAWVVAKDEKEENLRMILNFGHTAGHAIEKLSQYKIAHGYAVALGILVEAKIAVILGLLDEKEYILIEQLFARLEIMPDQLKPFNINDLIKVMQGDKKNKSGEVYMILLKRIGKVSLTSGNKVATVVNTEIIHNALASFGL